MRVLLALALCGVISAQLTPPTPLDDYIRRPDESMGYRLMETRDFTDHTIYFFNLTSQTWLTTEEVTQPLWWHWLTLVVPHVLDPTLDTCFLHIGTGNNRQDTPPNPETDSRILQGINVVRETGTAFAYIRQIPNQPIYFVKDNSSRSEDDAIAYTWRRYIDDPSGTNPDMLMRLPMTKAVIAAMDSITDFSIDNLVQPVSRFFLSGGSKRGWTVYTTAAADFIPLRVFGIAPKVISILNIQENFHHHRRSLGGWSFALADYWFEGLVGDLDHPNVPLLAGIVDPYAYLPRYQMPKLLIGGSSDEFFLPDSYRHFWNAMPEPKRLFQVSNTGHSMTGSPRFNDIWDAMKNFYMFAARDTDPPSMSWTMGETVNDGFITATVSEVPVLIRAWVANSISTVRRDFRRMAGTIPEETGVIWNETVVTRTDVFEYSVTIPKPSTGWRAFFIEAQFAGLLGSTAPTERLFFSTEINIIPDTLPFPRCQGWDDCQGILL